jgi:uncharacterized repeat protein (TIGR01451 family)
MDQIKQNSGFGRAFLAFCVSVFCALFLVAGPAAAQTTYISTADQAISETLTPCAAPLVRTFNVTAGATVTDVNIGLLLAHTQRSDLQMTLQSPTGTIVTLFNQTGTTFDNLNVLMDDSNANPISAHNLNNDTAAAGTVVPPFEETTYRPSSALSAFNGQPPKGIWTLRICDAVAANSGTFFQSNLIITAAATRVAGVAPALICPSGTTLHNWDPLAWAAGSTNNSYNIANVGNTSFTLANPGAWLNLAAYGGQAPNLNATFTGGFAVAERSLFAGVNLANQTQNSTITIPLPTAVPGLQFRIFDVDYGANQYADRMTVTGIYNGSPVNPTLTNGIANYVIGNSAYGDGSSTDAQANGNVVVTFNSPVDSVTISYGNHTSTGDLPADPGQQAISLHDITLCNPVANLSVTKLSSVVSDNVSVTNPKSIPGAVVRYCILVSNAGSGTATAVSVSDPIPSDLTFVPGSMFTGPTCTSASAAEDDNAIGADETDPLGMSFAGTTVTGTAATLAPTASFALVFNATVN